MICKWAYKDHVFEFDAKNKTEEIQKMRTFAKENGYKFSDLKKEDKG